MSGKTHDKELQEYPSLGITIIL